MLLERLAAQYHERPRYDWVAYYRWYYRQLGSEECERLGVWFCEHCLRVNRFGADARYGTCPGCQILRLRFGHADADA